MAGPRARRTRRQWIFLGLFGLLFALVVLGVAWVAVTGVMARSRLDAVRGELGELRQSVGNGDVSAATGTARTVAAQSASAHRLTTGPAWWVSSHIPLLGEPLNTIRVIADQADQIGTHALPGALRLAGELVRPPAGGTAIDLRPLQRASPVLAQADRTVQAADRAIRATDPSWLSPVARGRSSVLTALDSLDGQVASADRAVATLLPMLGSSRPQRYFIAFVNEAESRSIGGIPGAFTVVDVDRGQVTFTAFGSDEDLAGVRSRTPVSAEYRRLYGQDDPTGLFPNSDLSPFFPEAASIWAGMWQAHTGQHIDGAVAVDPTALGYLLDVTGPSRLDDGQTVTGDNVAALLQQKQYELYGGFDTAAKTRRKDFLISIARAVSGRVLDTPSLGPLARAARQAVAQRRLVVWDDNPGLEASLTHFGLAGVLTPGRAAFSAFFVNNAAGGKLDYYRRTAMTYARTGCTAHSTATATLTLTNATPARRLPPYVTLVLGGKPANARPGFTRMIVAYYATPGAIVRSVRVDGRPVIVASAPEHSLTTVRLSLDFQPGARHTVQVVTVEPAVSGATRIVSQPDVDPVTVSSSGPHC